MTTADTVAKLRRSSRPPPETDVSQVLAVIKPPASNMLFVPEVMDTDRTKRTG